MDKYRKINMVKSGLVLINPICYNIEFNKILAICLIIKL